MGPILVDQLGRCTTVADNAAVGIAKRLPFLQYLLHHLGTDGSRRFYPWWQAKQYCPSAGNGSSDRLNVRSGCTNGSDTCCAESLLSGA